MRANAIFFGWNRTIPGREKVSGEHFEEFVGYLTSLQQGGSIGSFDAVFLDPHGGDMNGFFLIRGEPAKLEALMATPEWVTHMTRAALHLQNAGAVRSVTGSAIAERMALWTRLASA
jgi:hypothetical protein